MSSGKLAADYDPDWPGITTLLAGDYGHMHRYISGRLRIIKLVPEPNGMGINVPAQQPRVSTC